MPRLLARTAIKRIPGEPAPRSRAVLELIFRNGLPAMQYLAALTVIFLLLLAATLQTGAPSWDGLKPEPHVTFRPAEPGGRQDPGHERARFTGRFDVAKIEPNGTSVFAGQSSPNALVTVLADGDPIGTAKADKNGEWVLVTGRPILNPNPKLSFEEVAQESDVTSMPQPANPIAPSAATVTARLMDDLRLRLDNARVEQVASDSANAVAPSQPGEDPTAAIPAGDAPQPSETNTIATRDALPVPIKFIFREAVLTDEGRTAAQLLLEYLLIKRPPSV